MTQAIQQNLQIKNLVTLFKIMNKILKINNLYTKKQNNTASLHILIRQKILIFKKFKINNIIILLSLKIFKQQINNLYN